MTICPHCAANLQGEPIPEQHRNLFSAATHYGREIGVQIYGVYDGVLYWQCPDCGGVWHRWPEGDELRERAEPFLQEHARTYSTTEQEDEVLARQQEAEAESLVEFLRSRGYSQP